MICGLFRVFLAILTFDYMSFIVTAVSLRGGLGCGLEIYPGRCKTECFIYRGIVTLGVRACPWIWCNVAK